MATIIKVNGQTITIAPKSAVSTESLYASIESLGNDIQKDINNLNVIGNIKAMEAFGYKSTEAVMEKVKAAGSMVIEKIKELYHKLTQFIGDVIKKIKEIITSMTKSGIHKNFVTMIQGKADFEQVMRGSKDAEFQAKCTLEGARKMLEVAQNLTNNGVQFKNKVEGMKLVDKLKAKFTGEGLDEEFANQLNTEAYSNFDKMFNPDNAENIFTDVKTFGEFIGNGKFEDIASASRVYIQQLPGAAKTANDIFAFSAATSKSIDQLNAVVESENTGAKRVLEVLKYVAQLSAKYTKSTLKYSGALNCLSKAERFCMSYYNSHKNAAPAA